MRVRHKPWAKEKIEQHPELVIPAPETHRGNWSRLFQNERPIHIEVGTGKGRFITEMAKSHPDINYIGIELEPSIIITALDLLLEDEVPNAKLLNTNGQDLRKFFATGEISRVYLNFSDPWPKKRHEKRRLTFSSFLDIYGDIMPEGGEIHFKTDNRGLFEYSLKSFSQYGLLLKEISLDLHNSDVQGNIMTEYEEKFSAMGHPIYRCEVQYQPKRQQIRPHRISE